VAIGLTVDASASVKPLDFRGTIDWQRPWMASLREIGQPLCVPDTDWRSAINAIASNCALTTAGGRLLKFVAQSELPVQTSYEAFIHRTGKVPTRTNPHDFLNALIWLSYPRIKARLNALQAADLDAALIPSITQSSPIPRSRLRDALTLFDENAVLVACSDPAIFDLLRLHAWTSLFIDHRIAFSTHCEVFVFGHALIEKLVTPYKAITAHAWLVLVDATFFTKSTVAKKASLDSGVAQQLDERLRKATFTPLPVLAVPGWCEAQDELFYADSNVFRPPRQI
jgi:hypothetical protein